jgi:hypothetical protein
MSNLDPDFLRAVAELDREDSAPAAREEGAAFVCRHGVLLTEDCAGCSSEEGAAAPFREFGGKMRRNTVDLPPDGQAVLDARFWDLVEERSLAVATPDTP